MKVCICRNIWTEDFKTLEDLEDRLYEKDYNCGTCLLNMKNEKRREIFKKELDKPRKDLL